MPVTISLAYNLKPERRENNWALNWTASLERDLLGHSTFNTKKHWEWTTPFVVGDISSLISSSQDWSLGLRSQNKNSLIGETQNRN